VNDNVSFVEPVSENESAGEEMEVEKEKYLKDKL